MGTETSVLAPRRRAVSGGSFHGQSSAMRDGSSNRVMPKVSCISADIRMIALTQFGSLISTALPPSASGRFQR